MITNDYFYVFDVDPEKILEFLGKVGKIGSNLTDLYSKYLITKMDGDTIYAKKYIRTTKKSKRDLFEDVQQFDLNKLRSSKYVFLTKGEINTWKDKLRNACMEYKAYLATWLKDINLLKIRAEVDTPAKSQYLTKEVVDKNVWNDKTIGEKEITDGNM